MKQLNRVTALLLALLLALSMSACGAKEEEIPSVPGSNGPSKPVAQEPEVPVDTEAGEETQQPDTGVTMRVAAMTGPTGMGLVALMDQFGVAETPQSEPMVENISANGNRYVFHLAGGADEISPRLIKGELDAACVPANLASVLYHKTKGEIVTMGINTLGVIYIVEKGESIQSLQGLKGKTIVSAGKGTVPEYGLRYLLVQNGIDPDKDLTIEWKSEQNECVAALASGAAEIAVMPQPFVTVAQGKVEGLRVAVSLTEEWEKLDNGSAMLTGVVVTRRSFAEEHPEAVEAFLRDYADSVAWVNGQPADAAQLIGNYGIVAAAVAEKALPHCNIVCITGAEMKEKLSGYLAALAEVAPEAVGGNVPAEDFYYGV